MAAIIKLLFLFLGKELLSLLWLLFVKIPYEFLKGYFYNFLILCVTFVALILLILGLSL